MGKIFSWTIMIIIIQEPGATPNRATAKRCHPFKKKLWRYPQQPQRFVFTNLSVACCEAQRWEHLSWVSVS